MREKRCSAAGGSIKKPTQKIFRTPNGRRGPFRKRSFCRSSLSAVHLFLPFIFFCRSSFSAVHLFLPLIFFCRSFFSAVHLFLPLIFFCRSSLSAAQLFLPFISFCRSSLSAVHLFLPFIFFCRSSFSVAHLFLPSSFSAVHLFLPLSILPNFEPHSSRETETVYHFPANSSLPNCHMRYILEIFARSDLSSRT